MTRARPSAARCAANAAAASTGIAPRRAKACARRAGLECVRDMANRLNDQKRGAAMAVGYRSRETYSVGGRHVAKPTGKARDSSLGDR